MLTSIENIPIEVKLEEILKKRGITPYALAQAIKIDASNIYDLKNKLIPIPNLKRLVIICNYLEIQISELIVIKYDVK